MPAAQMRRSPRSSGDGRLRASLAASLSHSRAYSASRCWVQNARVIAVISLKTGRTAAGSLGISAESAGLVTAGILPAPAPLVSHEIYRVCGTVRERVRKLVADEVAETVGDRFVAGILRREVGVCNAIRVSVLVRAVLLVRWRCVGGSVLRCVPLA